MRVNKSRVRAATVGSYSAFIAWWRTLRPSEWAMFGAFGVYCFVFPWAMLLMSFDWMPFGMEWMSSLLLAMLGFASAGWLISNYGIQGGIVGAGIFTVGVALEYLGVKTGFPFGAYRYTGVLVPELPGGVPLAIGFAWLLIVVGGLFTSRRLLPHGARWTFLLVPLVGALLAVGLDFLLEPVAYHIKGYWLWLGSEGGYYGIPLSNFAAWLMSALLMNLAVSAYLPVSSQKNRWTWLPVALFAMNTLLFGVVNVAHGYWLAGMVAIILLVLIIQKDRMHRIVAQVSMSARGRR